MGTYRLGWCFERRFLMLSAAVLLIALIVSLARVEFELGRLPDRNTRLALLWADLDGFTEAIRAGSFSLHCPGDGIATESERAAAPEVGSPLARGYLFGRPAPLPQLSRRA